MKTKLSLYEISQEFAALEELTELEGGEITPELEELQERCASLIKNKTDGFVSYIEMLKDEMALADLRAKKAMEFKKVRSNAIDRLSQFAIDSLKNANVKDFTGSVASIKLVKPTKVLSIENENTIPVQFLKTTPAVITVDKMALKKAIKNGDYEGDAARLVDGKQNVKFSLKSL